MGVGVVHYPVDMAGGMEEVDLDLVVMETVQKEVATTVEVSERSQVETMELVDTKVVVVVAVSAPWMEAMAVIAVEADWDLVEVEMEDSVVAVQLAENTAELRVADNIES